MPRSVPLARHCLTIRCLALCLEQAPPSFLGYLSPSVNNEIATRAQRISKCTPASRQLPKAAARSGGSTGDCAARNSYARHSSNGRPRQLLDPSGPALTIGSSGLRGVHTRPPCVHWPSSGSAFSIAVGKRERHMMSPRISTRLTAGVHRYLLRSPRQQKTS